VSKAAQPLLSPTVGILTGLLTGVIGSFVMPLVPYLQALDLDKDAFVQAMGLAFTVSTDHQFATTHANRSEDTSRCKQGGEAVQAGIQSTGMMPTHRLATRARCAPAVIALTLFAH